MPGSYVIFYPVSVQEEFSSSAGIVSMSVLSALPATRQQFLTTYDNVAVKQTAKSKSAAVVGGIISGAGMTIAGSVRSLLDSVPGYVM